MNHKMGSQRNRMITDKAKLLVFGLLLVFMACKSEKDKVATYHDAALDALTAAIKKDDKNPKLYFDRAKKFYEKEMYDLSIVDLKKAITLDSVNVDYYHLLSDVYLDHYNSKEAFNTLLKVLDLYPERVPSLLKMAELKHILEDYDGSLLTVNEVIRIDGQNAEGYFMLGINFKVLGDTTRAINAFQTAVELNSGLTDAWIMLGELYEAKKDPKALKYYESGILSDPSSMQALHAKAYYLQNNGDISKALGIYKQIILTDKSYEDAYLNAGLLYLELDSLDRAFEQFNILTGVAPTNYMGFYMRGVVQEKNGNSNEAKKDYESAYNLNKEDKKVFDALEKIKNQSFNN